MGLKFKNEAKMNSTQRWWFQGLGGLGLIFTTSSISSSQSYSLLLSSIYIGICTFVGIVVMIIGTVSVIAFTCVLMIVIAIAIVIDY